MSVAAAVQHRRQPRTRCEQCAGVLPDVVQQVRAESGRRKGSVRRSAPCRRTGTGVSGLAGQVQSRCGPRRAGGGPPQGLIAVHGPAQQRLEVEVHGEVHASPPSGSVKGGGGLPWTHAKLRWPRPRRPCLEGTKTREVTYCTVRGIYKVLQKSASLTLCTCVCLTREALIVLAQGTK